MMKQSMGLLLALVFALLGAVGVGASSGGAEEPTLEQRINGLELTPRPAPDWAQYHPDWYDFSRVDRIMAQGMSNYDTMQAVFLDVADTTPVTSCTSHAQILIAALEMVGFQTWQVSGLVTAKNGGLPFTYGSFPPGWTGHSWVAVVIDGQRPDNLVLWGESSGPGDISVGYGCQLEDVEGEVLFFDSNLYSVYGMTLAQCFAVRPQGASWYRDAGLVWRGGA